MQYIQILSLLILVIAAVTAGIDAFPVMKDWVDRIRIGRFADKQKWKQSITRVGIQWLNRTPKIKFTDNTRWVILDILRGNYTRRALQDWQEASLLLGIIEYINNNEDRSANKAVEEYLRGKLHDDGRWKVKPRFVDSAMLGYGIMNWNGTNPGDFKPALDEMWDMIRDHIGEDGTVMYRKAMKEYRYVDTIGFVCPFLIKYGLTYDNDECIRLAVKQIQAYERNGMLDNHFIPNHAYQVQSKFPVGLFGWGRGLGWFAIGLIDAWLELPDGHPMKRELDPTVKKFARAVIAFQGERGNWTWMAARKESRADSSATAMLAWFLLNASQIEDISEECSIAYERAVHYLMKVTRRGGAVDFSQGDTKDIGVYSGLFNVLPFTQGYCLRLMHKAGGIP